MNKTLVAAFLALAAASFGVQAASTNPERDFELRRHRKEASRPLQDRFNRSGRKQARCATTEKDRYDFPAARFVSCEFQVVQ